MEQCPAFYLGGKELNEAYLTRCLLIFYVIFLSRVFRKRKYLLVWTISLDTFLIIWSFLSRIGSLWGPLPILYTPWWRRYQGPRTVQCVYFLRTKIKPNCCLLIKCVWFRKKEIKPDSWASVWRHWEGWKWDVRCSLSAAALIRNLLWNGICFCGFKWLFGYGKLFKTPGGKVHLGTSPIWESNVRDL